MITIITDLFGVYTPYVDVSGVPLSGLAGVNWPWLAGVVLFSITLLSVFKIIGAVIKK